ncbi:hypothetical protein MLD38_031174 [Melastoma candidum]|uniref:Uncharacterized protein n=2 Tax=Melastoma candidum TaxID=119954 RepID=A0ACB9MR17_9MYRT|nr:hypothetical protein MLD38_031174 [Melastoma candidum]
MDQTRGADSDDDAYSFLSNYQESELRIASEFLTTWLPFLSRDLCSRCSRLLSDRINSLSSGGGGGTSDGKDANVKFGEDVNRAVPTVEHDCKLDDVCGGNPMGCADDESDANSLGSWKDGTQGFVEANLDLSSSNVGNDSAVIQPRGMQSSWADMAQEDELEQEEEDSERLSGKRAVDVSVSSHELQLNVVSEKPTLSREQREYIRFKNVQRNKDFLCFERVDGKLVNILQGLELHCGVFSAAEQKRIIDFIYQLHDMGKGGKLKERTYSAPHKWMRGKGRITIQFGCCYNYATDKHDSPPGILYDEVVDPLPPLFKVIIRRLIRWHVLPPTCIPDSCIVNIYEEGDCIPPHIDNRDFVRPFCTISFLSECGIIFGSKLKIVGPGEFSGSFAIPLPVGSVLVLNGNGADVAKHAVPAVPAKRISITFRRMDVSKRPKGYTPEPDLLDIQPLTYDVVPRDRPTPYRQNRHERWHASRRESNGTPMGHSVNKGGELEPRNSTQDRQGFSSRRRPRAR